MDFRESHILGNSVNKVYRQTFGGRRIPLSNNKHATNSEDATANAPATTLVVDGGPATSPLAPASEAALYLG